MRPRAPLIHDLTSPLRHTAAPCLSPTPITPAHLAQIPYRWGHPAKSQSKLGVPLWTPSSFDPRSKSTSSIDGVSMGSMGDRWGHPAICQSKLGVPVRCHPGCPRPAPICQSNLGVPVRCHPGCARPAPGCPRPAKLDLPVRTVRIQAGCPRQGPCNGQGRPDGIILAKPDDAARASCSTNRPSLSSPRRG